VSNFHRDLGGVVYMGCVTNLKSKITQPRIAEPENFESELPKGLHDIATADETMSSVARPIRKPALQFMLEVERTVAQVVYLHASG